MHFEDIWNDAEEVSSKLPEDSLEKSKILDRMRVTIDMLERDLTSAQEGVIVGELLFEICAYCSEANKRGTVINTASFLKHASDTKKSYLMDPKNEKSD